LDQPQQKSSPRVYGHHWHGYITGFSRKSSHQFEISVPSCIAGNTKNQQKVVEATKKPLKEMMSPAVLERNSLIRPGIL